MMIACVRRGTTPHHVRTMHRGLLLLCAQAVAPLGAAPQATPPAAAAGAGTSWVRPTARVLPSSIRKVHLVQACHLDVGFTGLAIDVVNDYFDTFFPAAIATAKALAANITAEARLVFTAQSWLLELYLDCRSD